MSIGLHDEVIAAIHGPVASPAEPGRFTLLASAISGRILEVAAAEPGAATWTDGATVFVDADASPRDQLQSVAVQAALLGAGSLDASVLRELRRGAIIRRYLAVEGHRALAELELFVPAAARSLIDVGTASRSDSPAASLALAAGKSELADPPATFGTIHPKGMRSSGDAADGGQVVAQHRPAKPRDEELKELDDGEDDDRPVVDILSSPVGGGGAIGKLLKRMFGDARSSGAGPPGADSATHWSRRASKTAKTVGLSSVTSPGSDAVDGAARDGDRYPEWDVHKRRYKPDWCTVLETDLGPEELAPMVAPDTHAFRRPLARLGMELERSRRQMQGDEIDVDAAVEARIDAMAGSVSDERVYIDTLRSRRDLSVLVLLDISGSSGQASAAGASVHDHQRAAAAALTIALHDHGDRVALYGFRSQGRSAVHVIPVKRFEDRLDTASMQRLGGFTPGGYTRLGAAIRHGATVLERDAGTARRLLVVISDGFAYDHGYEGAYGEADARRALAESRRRGTGCLCLSIGAGTDAEALRRVFGSAAHATIPRPELLPGVIGPLFRSSLRSAETQRRVALRRTRADERLELERRTA